MIAPTPPAAPDDLEFDTRDAVAVGPRVDRHTEPTSPRRSKADMAADFTKARDLAAAAAVPVESSKGEPLYLDIETVPDYSREHLFGLDPLPPVREESSVPACGDAALMLNQSVANFSEDLRETWPCDEFIATLIATEKAGKNRDGIAKEIESFRREKAKNRDAADERRKLMSTTPEYCRIVAVSWAIGPGEIRSIVNQEPIDGPYREIEAGMLARVMDAMGDRVVIGFGVAGFDIPTILTRCVILGVPVPRLIQRSAYRDDVIDLHSARFAGTWGKSMGLKPLARCLGIEVPAGDCDGSQVESLLVSDPQRVHDYVRSDVHITRELHRMYRGYFCK